MFIPVVKRSVTAKVAREIAVPFQCVHCNLTTSAYARAEGEGTAQALYVGPDQHVARQRAEHDMLKNAYALLWSAPCPQCGKHAAQQVEAHAQWQKWGPVRNKLAVATLVLGALCTIGAGIGGCVVGAHAADAAKGAFVNGLSAAVVGVIATLVAVAIVSPPKEPKLCPENPEGVRFDPVEPPYRQPS